MITSATCDHLNQIFDIENLSFDQPWSLNHFENDLVSNSSQNLIYLENGNVKGYLFGWVIEDKYHLNNIAVHPSFRNQGIARELLKNIISRMKKEEVNTIYLEVNSRNLLAIQFYKSFDFEKTGLCKDYYGENEDAELYTLNLEL